MTVECECVATCACGILPGPAAYSVKRGDSKLAVCTRCSLPGDEILGMVPDVHTDAEVFLNYDSLGFLALLMRMKE